MTYLNNILKITLASLRKIERITITMEVFGYSLFEIEIRVLEHPHLAR